MTTSRVLSTDASTSALTADALDPADVVAGSPEVSSTSLLEADGVAIGIWQITEGAVTDTEADEVFVVLSGRAEVMFDHGETVPLGPGSVVRLHAGERTTWTITETLRKIYVLLPDHATKEEAP
ncbi:MAG: cupin domain-containing protein [Aeromicrobium sp.]